MRGPYVSGAGWTDGPLMKYSAILAAGVVVIVAAAGHVLGLKFHRKLQETDSVVFYRVMGSVLLIVSFIGLLRAIA